MFASPRLSAFLCAALCFFVIICACPGCAAAGEVMDLGQEQAKEKMDLQEMRGEMNKVRGTMGEAIDALNQIVAEVNRPKVKEFRLVAKESSWELFPGTRVQALTYNGQIPGPSIRVREGDFVRVILQNDLRVPTSLHFHGLVLPGSVDGLPRSGSGLVSPGKAYAYQFQVMQPGTFWYHPQVMNGDQQARGMYGAIVVEPATVPKTYERDYLVVLGQSVVVSRPAAVPVERAGRTAKTPAPSPVKASASAAAKTASPPPPDVLEVISPSAVVPPSAVTYFTINGKSAPSIPAMEVHSGERVRLRIINGSQQMCPLHLSGHKFEVMSTNGADGLEAHVTRDTVALQPGDRFDLEFSADNPGVWSLASGLAAQTSNNGKFPGGMAQVLRYVDSVPAK